MGEALPDQITLLLQQMKLGDSDARARLASLVYPQLKKIAAQHMRRERPDHTLQPTALVHEAFLRLAGSGEVAWQNRSHFFALAAELMRQILVDYARRRRAAKRGGAAEVLELQEWQARIEEHPELVLEVDRLLTRLNSLDSRQAKVVEMRYFAGLTEEEIAGALGVSERTVKRDWNMARAWMRKELSVR
jgi:RNA polymerase sigma factor (TIGR02999 family)